MSIAKEKAWMNLEREMKTGILVMLGPALAPFPRTPSARALRVQNDRGSRLVSGVQSKINWAIRNSVRRSKQDIWTTLWRRKKSTLEKKKRNPYINKYCVPTKRDAFKQTAWLVPSSSYLNKSCVVLPAPVAERLGQAIGVDDVCWFIYNRLCSSVKAPKKSDRTNPKSRTLRRDVHSARSSANANAYVESSPWVCVVSLLLHRSLEQALGSAAKRPLRN